MLSLLKTGGILTIGTAGTATVRRDVGRQLPVKWLVCSTWRAGGLRNHAGMQHAGMKTVQICLCWTRSCVRLLAASVSKRLSNKHAAQHVMISADMQLMCCAKADRLRCNQGYYICSKVT